MTQPASLAPNGTRTKLVVTIVIFGLLVLLGAQIVDPRISRRVLAGVVATTGIIAGIIPALGTQRPRAAYWLVRASAAAAMVGLGGLVRMLIEAFRR